MSDDNGVKPEEQYPQLIFKAEVVKINDKKIVALTYKTSHIPTLDNIVQQLSFDIIELRTTEKTKQEMAKISLLTKNPIQSLNQFLNRKRR